MAFPTKRPAEIAVYEGNLGESSPLVNGSVLVERNSIPSMEVGTQAQYSSSWVETSVKTKRHGELSFVAAGVVGTD